MNLLLKNVLIADASSSFFQQQKDILIVDGIIHQIEDTIQVNEAHTTILHQPNMVVSQGWVDVFTDIANPGFEYRETLTTVSAAAIAGGFTQLFSLPNTAPKIDYQSQVAYLVEASKSLPIQIHPLGAISKNIEGKDLAEMYDMQNSGAVAFTDGNLPVQSAGLFLKALQYVKAFDGTLIQIPVDHKIGSFGLMNEGIVSTQLGLPGIPYLSEILMIKRDIDLLKYTQSKLHITGVATAEGIALIETAKKEGLHITCSVTPFHLMFCDEDLVTYDTNLKLNPPLRSRSDMMALRSAVENGVVDCIASQHAPQNWDSKVCEFEYAKHGSISLQTAFAQVNQVLPNLSAVQIANLFSNNVKVIFKLPNNPVEIGKAANITIFTRENETVLTQQNNQSKSANSALFNIPLKGKVLGVVAKNKVHLQS